MKGKKFLFLLMLSITAVSLFAALRYNSEIKQFENVQAYLSALETKIESFQQINGNSKETNSNINMDTANINGCSYIGIIRFPDAGLSLPVLSSEHIENAGFAPILSSGSVKLNDIVISLKSNAALLEQLENLSCGEYICFTDMDGNISYYSITEIQQHDALSIGKINADSWDLTFIAYTAGNTGCYAFRCAAAV